jgi:Ku C terminal domain like
MLGTGACVSTIQCMNSYRPLGNSILRKLKIECTKEPGNPAFWDEVKKNKLGLITASEASKHGGKSNIADSLAEEVSRFLGEIHPADALQFWSA